MEEAKKPWKSKTLWFNLFMAVFALAYPKGKEFLTPAIFDSIWGLGNIVLRLFTKEEVKLLKK